MKKHFWVRSVLMGMMFSVVGSQSYAGLQNEGNENVSSCCTTCELRIPCKKPDKDGMSSAVVTSSGAGSGKAQSANPNDPKDPK